MTTLNNEEKNPVRLNDHIITEDGVIVNINDIPTVSRWYDKWSNINDEDGVVNRYIHIYIYYFFILILL